jgi:hypothetical protein
MQNLACSVEIQVDDLADSCDLKGHHQVLVCGRHAAALWAFAILAAPKRVRF